MGRNIRRVPIFCKGVFHGDADLSERLVLGLSMGKKYAIDNTKTSFFGKKKGKKRTLEVGKRKLGAHKEAKESEEMALKMAKEIEEMALEMRAAGAEEKK